MQLKPKLGLPGFKAEAVAAPKPVPPEPPKKPEPDPTTRAERALFSYAIKNHRMMRFTWLDGSFLDAIPVSLERYCAEVEGDELILKHAVRSIKMLPIEEEQK
jgi:hypothetical protein